MQLGSRLRTAIERKGISQAELARRVGISQPSINHLINKGAGGSAHLHKIARELDTTPAYLTGETDDPAGGTLSREDVAAQFDLVAVASINLEYGLGFTFTDLPVEVEIEHFPRRWLEAISKSPPSALTWARGRGDSMWPTIGDKDMVLIDRSQKTILEQDAIWCFTLGDVGMIKRLRLRGRTVTILSDNDRVPPDQADADEVNMIGRVQAIIRGV